MPHTFYLAHKAATLANTSRTWPTTTGKVLASDIARTHLFQQGDVYTPVVRYEYSLDGRRYEGEVVAFGMTSLRSRQKAEGYLKDREAGAAVTVHYNPQNPADATLDTSSLQASALRRTGWVFVGITAFVYGLMALGFVGR